jgi:cytochrome c oxidase subunit IV
MATTTTTTETHHEAHEHPSDGHYIKIALILAFLTAAETATYFIPTFEENTTLLWICLAPVMILKFGMVAWYFMHLKSDSRMFSRFFLTGIVLAVIVYMIFLLAFDEFF